jgi:ribonuclease-3
MISGKDMNESHYHQAKIEGLLGCKFADEELLKKALVHRSYAYYQGGSNEDSNERLEFLGDAVLQLVITDYLFQTNLEASEGDLTKARAFLVNYHTLATIAREKGLGKYVLLSPEEEEDGGREKDSILSDALEALIGAVYIDQGLSKARDTVLRLFNDYIDIAMERATSFDYKTLLQELTLKTRGVYPEYQGWDEGPDHRKVFHVEVIIEGQKIAEGKGRSKKEAEQQAAQEAYNALVNEPERRKGE